MTLQSHLDGAIFAEHLPGDARPIVLLHGWGRDRFDLLKVVPPGHPCVSLDLPGFGASPPPPDAWGADGYAAAVAGVIRECAFPTPAIVVGHSFGGRVAVALAASQPNACAGLVVTGAPLLRLSQPPSPSLSYRLVRFANRIGIVPDSVLEQRRQRTGSSDYRAATGIMRDVLVRAVNESYQSELEQIRCPVSLCYGANDTAAPPAVAEASARLIADVVDLRIVDGSGHDVHRDAPQELIASIERVDRALDQAASA